jgi:hypothetical protein
MKNVLVAMVCTLGAVACGGENRAAEDPSTVTSAEATTNTRAQSSTPVTPSHSTTAHTTSPSDGRTTSSSGVGTTTREAPAPATTPNTTPNTNLDTSTPAPTTSPAPAADNAGVANGTKDANNTKINDRDRHGALTPMDQGGGNDRDITAAIRRSVVGDKALSFSAKNVKIITVGGKVTLRGPVKSDAEKTAIEAKAKSAAGVSEVDNQLEVKK